MRKTAWIGAQEVLVRTVYCSDSLTGDRRKGWQDVIAQNYAHLEIEIPARTNFFGRICRSVLSNIELTEVVTDSELARRTARHIARDSRESYLYLLVRAGSLNVVQFNRDCTIGAGEFTLVDLNAPYIFRHSLRVEKVGVKVPRYMLRSRTNQLAQHCAVSRKANEGLPHLVASYVNEVCKQVPFISDTDAHGVSRTTSDLFGLLFESVDPAMLPDETAVRAALRRRCMAYIDAHCAYPGLDPASIAGALGISVRYLHRCFESADVSVMEYLRLQRLRRCHADLADPSCNYLPIAEIARRNGFRNVCHFNEAFKAEYGISPGEVRRSDTGRQAS
jgi:AraC-like DNA-binding protein